MVMYTDLYSETARLGFFAFGTFRCFQRLWLPVLQVYSLLRKRNQYFQGGQIFKDQRTQEIKISIFSKRDQIFQKYWFRGLKLSAKKWSRDQNFQNQNSIQCTNIESRDCWNKWVSIVGTYACIYARMIVELLLQQRSSEWLSLHALRAVTCIER